MRLSEFIPIRRKEIEEQITALQRELVQLNAAERALGDAPSSSPLAPNATAPNAIPDDVTRRRTRMRANSIKEWVLKVLAQDANGMETDAIIEAVRAIGGPIVPRTSMSPQLSRLKSEGLIVHDGRRWKALVVDYGGSWLAADASDASHEPNPAELF